MQNKAPGMRRILQPGETLFREGDPGDCAYYIEYGEIEIFVERDGEQVMVARRPGHEIIGEMAIIDDAPRSASAIASKHTETIAISKEQLQRRLGQADPMLKACVNTVLWRFRNLLASVSLEQSNGSMDDEKAGPKLTVLDDDVFGALTLEHDLQVAIAENQLEMHYQPIVSLSGDDPVAGFEALMRWPHPEKGMISPALFIPAAEAANLMTDLTRVALSDAIGAMEQMNALRSPDDAPLFMSINISGRDLESDDFVDFLRWTLDKADVRPEQVKLEITETILMSDAEGAARRLKLCRDLGCGVSIDDFGTGYSSLSYLGSLPFDTLKIDRSFVAAMDGDASAAGVIRTILALGHEFGAKVVAEGVETLNEVEFLRNVGCDFAQGWYYARAESLEDTLALLSREQVTESQDSMYN